MNNTNDLGRSLRDGLSPTAEPVPVSPAVAASIPSAWEIEFEAPPGARVLGSRFMGINVGFGDPETPQGQTLWWDCDNNHWRSEDEIAWGKNNPDRTYSLSSSAPCRSFKAFRRHLRRHSGKLSGRRLRLVSRFVGHDVWAVPASVDTHPDGGDAKQAPCASMGSAVPQADAQGSDNAD